MTGRPKTFDIDKLMDESVKLFWRQGYQGTSVRDIAKGANMTTGTLYNEFEGKEGLYAATVEHYFKKVMKPRVDTILLAKQPAFLSANDVDSPVTRLKFFLVSSVENIPKQVAYQSCLVLNTQNEFGKGDSLIQTAASNASDYVAKALMRTVKEAKSLDLINSVIPDREVLVLIQIFFSGLLMTAKHLKSSKNLVPAVEMFLKQLQYSPAV